MKRNYMVLIAAGIENIRAVQKLLDGIKRKIDAAAVPRWIDSRGAGILIATDLVSIQIWRAIFTAGNLTDDEDASIKDLLIIELGQDWMARGDSPSANWLKIHGGRPLPDPSR